MSASSGELSSSLDGSDVDDLDDIPLSMARNGRYEQCEPSRTSKGPPLPFSRVGPGFQLKLPVGIPEDLGTLGDGLVAMRSEPVDLPETARNRPPAGPGLLLGQLRVASASQAVPPEVEALQRTRRGPLKPPMLSLVSPASASPVQSSTPTPAAFLQQPETAADPSQSRVRVELVSSAFLLENLRDQPGEASTSDRITERCSWNLGVSACDLEFYELRPLDGLIPDSCAHVGVMVRGSMFSLAALEDGLARRRQDDQLTTMFERALRDSAQHAETSAKQGEELATLREKLRGMEATNQHLREQLKASDEHRHTLMGTISGIVREFGNVKSHVGFEGAVDQLSLLRLSLGSGAVAAGDPSASGSGAGGRDVAGRR